MSSLESNIHPKSPSVPETRKAVTRNQSTTQNPNTPSTLNPQTGPEPKKPGTLNLSLNTLHKVQAPTIPKPLEKPPLSEPFFDPVLKRSSFYNSLGLRL